MAHWPVPTLGFIRRGYAADIAGRRPWRSPALAMHNSHVEPVQTHGTDAHLRAAHTPCSDGGVDPGSGATAGRARTSWSHHASHCGAGRRLSGHAAAVLPEQGRDPGRGDGAQAERRGAKGSPSPLPPSSDAPHRPRVSRPLARDPGSPGSPRALSRCGPRDPECTAVEELRASAPRSILDRQQPLDPSGSLRPEGSAAIAGSPRPVSSRASGPLRHEHPPRSSGSLITASHSRRTAASAHFTGPRFRRPAPGPCISTARKRSASLGGRASGHRSRDRAPIPAQAPPPRSLIRPRHGPTAYGSRA